MIRTVPFRIPVEFILERCVVSGPQIAYGVSNGWLSPEDAVHVAAAKLAMGCAVSATEERLAHCREIPSSQFSELIADLQVSSESTESRSHPWLFLALDWLYEHRSEVEDPFELIEVIYGEFDYAPEIADLVRWMPVPEGTPLGLDAIESRWKARIESFRAQYAPDCGP